MAEHKKVKPNEPKAKAGNDKGDEKKPGKSASRKAPRMFSDRTIKAHVVPVAW